MNVNLKIGSKSIVNILRQVIPDLIHPDETAYVKDKDISESVRVIEDILDHADQKNLDGILFVEDTEKAFDSVEHNLFFLYSKI